MPRRACAERVTVVVLCVCVCLSAHAILAVRAIKSVTKDTIVFRKCLCSTPVLAYPDFSRSFILDTDASNVGIGAVLSQVDKDGQGRVISYGSRALTKPERRYCVTRKELLAVVTFIQLYRRPPNRPGFSGTIPEIQALSRCPEFLFENPGIDGPGYGVKYLCVTRKRDRLDRVNCV